MTRTGTWRITDESGRVYLIDWDRLRFTDTTELSSDLYGDALWRQIVVPPAAIGVGKSFEVLVAERDPRRTERIVKVEPFEWAGTSAAPTKPPTQTSYPKEIRSSPSKPARPRPANSVTKPAAPQPLWTAAQLASYLNVKVKTIYNWRTKGEGPPAVSVGGSPRWEQSAVDRWIAQRTEHSPGQSN